MGWSEQSLRIEIVCRVFVSVLSITKTGSNRVFDVVGISEIKIFCGAVAGELLQINSRTDDPVIAAGRRKRG